MRQKPTVADFRAMGLIRLRELKATSKAAPVVTSNTGGTSDEFAAYDINAHLQGAK